MSLLEQDLELPLEHAVAPPAEQDVAPKAAVAIHYVSLAIAFVVLLALALRRHLWFRYEEWYAFTDWFTAVGAKHSYLLPFNNQLNIGALLSLRAVFAVFGLRNYTQNLLDHGFTEPDLADGGSGRLIDAAIPHGGAEQIGEAVRAHLDAGADHVCLQPLGEEGIPRDAWTALAKALID